MLIALEPEAASIYVRRLRKSQLVPEKAMARPLSPCRNPDMSVIDLDHGVGEDIKPGTNILEAMMLL